MLDTATYTPRLKAEYKTRIRAALMEEFGYKNEMQLPRLDKIVLNMGIGEAVKDTKKVKSAEADLTLIAGQKAVITKAKNSIAGFRVREEMPLGVLDAPPVQPVFLRRKVGDGDVVAAGHAQFLAFRRKPVAGIVAGGVGAQPILRADGPHGEGQRLVGLGRAAMDADRVVEIHGLAAIAALEDAHVGISLIGCTVQRTGRPKVADQFPRQTTSVSTRDICKFNHQ